ncbi:MAG: hypothetical protein H7Y04_10905 [Verrucomicrobia bacterium]|nr:hypothetical protein [Cytophagales bacterium]
MDKYKEYSDNLNIWYFLPEEIDIKTRKLYEKMPGWMGFDKNGIPYWFGFDGDEVSISPSVEPSGLLFFATMEKNQWCNWLTNFKELATKELGFPVGEPEEGFE